MVQPAHAQPVREPVSVASLQRLTDFTIATGLERLKEKHGGKLPASITLDLDATDDPTHGEQQLTLFHGYYGQYQHFPLIVSEPTTKHVFMAALRPGTVHAALGADDDLMRIVNALRQERPDIVIHVRGDAAFGVPWMYAVCENNSLFYTFGFSSNPRLKRLTEGLMRILDRAGIEPWPKLFQNLRSSRQTELTETSPAHVVCVWMGNSEIVAQNHYLQVTDEHFAKALGLEKGKHGKKRCKKRCGTCRFCLAGPRTAFRRDNFKLR